MPVGYGGERFMSSVLAKASFPQIGGGGGVSGVRGTGVRQNALARWLGRQKQATGMFGQAEQPLRESVQMFQPGGGYGAGQKGLLQEQARQAQAEALSTQVATGMSSGSLATGTGLRVKRDLAQGLTGVEDVRTQFLTQALQSLSGLRGQRAQTLATTQDPTYAPYMSYLGGAETRASQEAMAMATANTRTRTPSQFNRPRTPRSGSGFVSANQYYR